MKSANWHLSEGGVEMVRMEGRDALKIHTGNAELADITLQDGLVEFDVYTSGLRSFVYLLFRGQSESDYEDFYLRPHKSDLPDALQYAPVFQRRSAWQLYHGAQGTASVALPARQWVSVRVELVGRQAKFWIGDGDQPSMVIERLGKTPAPGWLAFRGFVPGNSNAPFAAYFSNLRITPYEVEAVAQRQESEQPADGRLLDWRVSEAFAPSSGPSLSLPALIESGAWSPLAAQDSGVIEFLRHRRIPQGVRRWAVAAEVVLQAQADQLCAVNLGFSDELTLSLNGQQLLYQDQSFRFDGPRRQGVMHAEMLTAYLPLVRGKNRLRAIVADRFGGWGLSARLLDCDGVVATPS